MLFLYLLIEPQIFSQACGYTSKDYTSQPLWYLRATHDYGLTNVLPLEVASVPLQVMPQEILLIFTSCVSLSCQLNRTRWWELEQLLGSHMLRTPDPQSGRARAQHGQATVFSLDCFLSGVSHSIPEFLLQNLKAAS